MIAANPISPVTMVEVTDPKELAAARIRRQRFDRNWEWFQSHASEIYQAHRGKCICIAGQELFVGDTSEQALALATAAHPDDDGRFVHYIYKERMPRIYANCRRLDVLR